MQKLDINAAKTGYLTGIDVHIMSTPSK